MKKNILAFFIIVIISTSVVFATDVESAFPISESLNITLTTKGYPATTEIGISTKSISSITDGITHLNNMSVSFAMDDSGTLVDKNGNSYFLNWVIISRSAYDISVNLSPLTPTTGASHPFTLVLTKIAGDASLSETQSVTSDTGDIVIYKKQIKEDNNTDFGSLRMRFEIPIDGENDVIHKNYTSQIIVKITPV